MSAVPAGRFAIVDRGEQAQKLVDAWAKSDDDVKKVFGFHVVADRDDEPVDFLIVSGSAVPSGTVEPFGFGRSKEVPFSTRIATVPEDEFEAKKNDLGYLPRGWRLEDAVSLDLHR